MSSKFLLRYNQRSVHTKKGARQHILAVGLPRTKYKS